MHKHNPNGPIADYLATLAPMRRAKARATLETQVRHNGGDFWTRAALVEFKVSVGSRVQDTKHFGVVLMDPDGAFLDSKNITATGLDYARFLSAQMVEG